MNRYFISLDPNIELYTKIMNSKKLILKKFGDQQYLMDPPHITLYVGKTDNIRNIGQELDKYVKDRKIKKIGLKIVDFLIFDNDKVTQKTAVALKFDDKTIKYLRVLQKEIINSMITSGKIFRSKDEIHERYRKVNFSAIEQNDLKKYGYPYVGQNWLPHFSFCTIDSILKEKVMNEVSIDKFVENKSAYSISGISLYILKKDKPYKIKTIELM